jgi:hypothetical protein
LTATVADVSAQTTTAPKEKAAKPAACKTLKDESGCGARTDCSWVPAAVSRTGKETRRAYCRSKPKAKAKTQEKA